MLWTQASNAMGQQAHALKDKIVLRIPANAAGKTNALLGKDYALADAQLQYARQMQTVNHKVQDILVLNLILAKPNALLPILAALRDASQQMAKTV